MAPEMATGGWLIKSAALANGLKLPYAEQGDRSGVPVVFLHAFADSWRSFERVLPCLPRSIRAIAPTQRGHGDADRPGSGYGVEDFTRTWGRHGGDRTEAAVIVASTHASLTAQRLLADPGRTLGLRYGALAPSRQAGVATFLGVRQSGTHRPGHFRECVEATSRARAAGLMDGDRRELGTCGRVVATSRTCVWIPAPRPPRSLQPQAPWGD